MKVSLQDMFPNILQLKDYPVPEESSDFHTFLRLASKTYKATPEDVIEMKTLIGKNQNRPPQGRADGSFTDEQWTNCRDYVNMLEQLYILHTKIFK